MEIPWNLDGIKTECHPNKTPTDFRRNPHGIRRSFVRVTFRRDSVGIPSKIRWSFVRMTFRRDSMENPWKIHGISMDSTENPWNFHGFDGFLTDSGFLFLHVPSLLGPN